MRFEKELRGISRRISMMVATTLRQPIEEAARAERQDAEIDLLAVRLRLSSLRARVLRIVDDASLSPLLRRISRAVQSGNANDMERILSIPFEASPEVEALLAVWRRENVQLIRSIATRQLDDVEALVTQAATSGMRVETLRGALQERFRVSRSRASLIARDQVLTANAQLTRARNEEAGVTQYIWSTSSDERVRDRHAELEGRTFSWNDPPVTSDSGARNHPGEDIQCRCVAIPVILGP